MTRQMTPTNLPTRAQQLPDEYELHTEKHTYRLQQVRYPDDLPLLYRWMHSEHVIEQWQLNIPMPTLAVHFEKMLADDHQRLYLILQDGRALGYAEVYEAKRDRLARYDDVEADDMGWHLLIGETDLVRTGLLRPVAMLLSDFIFQNSPAQKIVGEPDENVKAYAWAAESLGYEWQRTLAMPEKNASLYYCYRQPFYESEFYQRHQQACVQ